MTRPQVLGGDDSVEADGDGPGEFARDLGDGLLVALAQRPPFAYVGPLEQCVLEVGGEPVAHLGRAGREAVVVVGGHGGPDALVGALACFHPVVGDRSGPLVAASDGGLRQRYLVVAA